MKIIVAHEGKQHSFRTAEAFYRNGSLFKYITTVYDKPWSLTRLTKLFLRGNAKKKSSSRKSSMLENEFVLQFCEFEGLLLLLLRRISILSSFVPVYNNWLHNRFGKKVAYFAIKHNVDAVIMYDGNCNKCWEILKRKAPGIKRIMDVSIANRLFLKKVYERDIAITQNYNLQKEQFFLWNSINLSRFKKEIEDSDFFLAGSNMVKRSLLYSGVESDKIFIVPYGVNINKFSFHNKVMIKGPLKLVFVGQLLYRKGIHHLLSVVSSFPIEKVELYIAGSYDKNSDTYKKYKCYSNIHFLGFVTRDILSDLYVKSDVFVLPSLGEGLALVVLEALSSGVPCIVSDMTGANDLIEDGKNGFVFEASNDEQLKEKIQWFIDNPQKIPEMSEYSRKSVINQTWESYYNNAVKVVNKILKS